MSKMYDPLLFAADRVDAPRSRPGRRWATAMAPLAWLWREIQARHDRHLLAALDERGLADIGLSRSAIDYVVRNGRGPIDTRSSGAACPTERPQLPASAWTEWR